MKNSFTTFFAVAGLVTMISCSDYDTAASDDALIGALLGSGSGSAELEQLSEPT